MAKKTTQIDPFNPPYPPTYTSTGGSLRDLQCIRALAHYGMLPTRHIRHLLGEYYGKQVMTRLNKGHYIGVSKHAELLTMDARNREYVWEAKPRGETLVGVKASRLDRGKHKLMCSVIRFSFDIAVQEIEGLRLIPLKEILERDTCPHATRSENNPNEIPLPNGTTIKPDGDLFGYEYTLPDGRKRYFYLHGFEANRATETYFPGTQTAEKKKNIKKMIEGYTAYLEKQLYKTRYGISNISIAIVCNSEQDLKNVAKVIEAVVPKYLLPYFLLTWIDGFLDAPNKERKPYPPPTGDLVTRDWYRVGNTPQNILAVLKGEGHGRATTDENRGATKAA